MELEDSFEIREETAQRLIGHRGGCRLDILLGHVRLYSASERIPRTCLKELEIPHVLFLGRDQLAKDVLVGPLTALRPSAVVVHGYRE
jgi:hypothetical protein